MISDQRIAELMGWSANPAHVTGVLGGGPDDLPARVRAVAQAAAEAALAHQGQEPAFWGFLDTEQCRVDLCFSPTAPRADGTFATAYYTAPPPCAPYTAAPQRKPLTNEQIRRVKPVCAHFESFRAGIRFMEREIGLHA